MKKLKILLFGLGLVLSLSTFNAPAWTARANSDDPQGGGDATKHPPCYPRCRPVLETTSNGGTPTQAAVAANTTAVADDSAVSNITLNEILVLVWTQFALYP